MSGRRELAVFAGALVAFGAVAGPRLGEPSRDPHFVLQADAWLHGRLDVDPWPRGADDPARVESVVLRDGRALRGRRVAARGVFRSSGGEEVPLAQVARSRGTRSYVAFPPFPAVLLLPQAALFGRRASDVTATVVLAALAPVLLLLVLRRLRAAGLVRRTPAEELWLAALLAFGTVFFFSAVQGRVWYTAHVVAVDLCLLYVWASVGASRPLLAGTCLGLAFVTRAPLLFAFPLFALEAWRARRSEWVRVLALFALPVAVVGLLAAWHNEARFGEATEFGHRYLVVRQTERIERGGLFSVAYLPRNLAAALALLPRLSGAPPYLSISGHGLALWITTPVLALLAVRRPGGPLGRALWLSVACVAPWTLLYQNTGWLQFGYRFSLDYTVFLVLLLALDPRPFGVGWRALAILGIGVNLFGAITFDRHRAFYRRDRAAYERVLGLAPGLRSPAAGCTHPSGACEAEGGERLLVDAEVEPARVVSAGT